MITKEYKLKNIFMGKLDNNDDLFETLIDFCCKHKIKTGHISLIGAVKNIKIGYYKQQEKQYINLDELSNRGPFEIASCSGNISTKDNTPAIHLHIVVSDKNGNCYGGHLLSGTKIFACEFIIHSYEGDELVRGYDSTTGLPLWI